jgi:hypothetical protein
MILKKDHRLYFLHVIGLERERERAQWQVEEARIVQQAAGEDWGYNSIPSQCYSFNSSLEFSWLGAGQRIERGHAWSVEVQDARVAWHGRQEVR